MNLDLLFTRTVKQISYNQILRNDDENPQHAQRRVIDNEVLGTHVPKHLSVYPFKWDADLTITDDVTREGVVGTIRVEDIEKLSGKSKPLRDTITLILVTRSTSPYLYLNEHKLKSWILEHFYNVITTSTLLHECNRIMKNTNQSFYDLMPSKQNEIDLEPRHLMFLYVVLFFPRYQHLPHRLYFTT